MTDGKAAALADALRDRYALERELGAGGMATVYLARDLKHDRDVALKVLRPELAAALGAERFLQEIRISAGLDHPHILTLIDSGESEGFVWYVLPYVRVAITEVFDAARAASRNSALLRHAELRPSARRRQTAARAGTAARPTREPTQPAEALVTLDTRGWAVRAAGGVAGASDMGVVTGGRARPDGRYGARSHRSTPRPGGCRSAGAPPPSAARPSGTWSTCA